MSSWATAAALSIAVRVGLRPLTPNQIAAIEGIEPESAEPLSAVISRLRFIDALRYELPMDPQNIAQAIDRDALETYLLCTCLDSLAADQPYVELQNWLRTNKRAAPGVAARDALMTTAIAASSPFSVDAFKAALTQVLDVYNQHYGTNQRVLQMIRNLPDSERNRLASAYSIEAEQIADGSGWDSKSTPEKLATIFVGYILRCRRNKYTHRSEAVPPFGGIAMMREALQKGEVNPPRAQTRSFDLDGGRTYRITCHHGDEGLFLRETIFACVAARLGVLTEDWTDRYRDAERRRRAVYALRYELEHNRLIIQFHLGILSQSITYRNAADHHWPMLETLVAEAVLTNRFSGVPNVGGLESYIQAASAFNREMVRVIQSGGADSNARARAAASALSETSLDFESSRLLLLYGDYLDCYPRWILEPWFVPLRGEP